MKVATGEIEEKSPKAESKKYARTEI